MLRIILFIALFAFGGPLSAQPTNFENQAIEKIDILFTTSSMNKPPIIQAVKARLKIQEGKLFSHLDFDSDLKALVKDYDRIEPQIRSVQGKVHITLKISLKPTIRTITWSGNHKVATKRLKRELNIPICSIFDRQAFNLAFHKLKAYYIKKGFFEAQLDYKVKQDPLTNVVDIQIFIEEGRSGKIKDVIFENLTCREEQALLEQMVTKKYCFIISLLTNEGVYNDDAIQRDQFVILNYLQNKGYADANVEVFVTEVPECSTFEMKIRDRILVNVWTDKGPRYYFGDVSFSGNTLFCDEDIQSVLLIREGEHYSPEKIRDTIELIKEIYGRRGYIDASVNYEISLAQGDCIYNVNLVIEEGEQFRVGLIKVFGNCTTETHVILRETLLIPGEIFNTVKLRKTEERLHNIGYFKNVNVYAVKSESACTLGPNYRDVHIEVEEMSTGKISAFFGYSTVESFFCGLNIAEENFNAKGLWSCWNRPGALRGGGEYASLNLTVGVKSRSYGFSWTKPHVYDTPWSIGFDIQKNNKRYVSDDYDINNLNLIIRAFYQFNAFVKIGYHYRYTNGWIDITTNHPPESLRKAAKVSGDVSAYGVSLIYDSTNNPVRPTKGFKSTGEMEIAGIWGSHRFLSFAYLNAYYIEMSSRGYMKYRWDFRTIDPFSGSKEAFDDIPIDERLFLGGDNTIRGYRPYKLGPHFGRDSDDPKGGLSMSILSAEYNHQINKRLEGFVFADAGNISNHRYRFDEYFRMSAGFGFRLKILESYPPITFGMGFPINPKNRSEVKRFFLTFGGRF